MTFGSLFAGIGGFDLGFERAGMNCAWQVENDPQKSKILERHWPRARRASDVRSCNDLSAVDVVCGGFPCTDLSVAGRREGLVGKRSGLWFEFLRIVGETLPGWVVVENVPGLLYSHGGRDFAAILQGLGELGYLSAWRVLDSQWFGVPQRRRRVFVVASFGNGRSAKVLLEPDCVSRRPASERQSLRERRIARDAAAGIGSASGVAGTLMASGAGASRVAGMTYERDFLVFNWKSSDSRPRLGKRKFPCLVRSQEPAMGTPLGVRRFTPVECLRLQGFPDDWMNGFSNTAVYKATGDAVTVPVAEWIGRRIMENAK